MRQPLGETLAGSRASWDALVSAMPHATPFHSWAWHRAAEESTPPSERSRRSSLQLAAADGTPEAILPLLAQRVPFRRAQVRALGWASGLAACPDHLDILARPGAEVEAFVPVLEALPWDAIILSDVAERAPGVERLTSAFAARGHHVTRAPLHCCPYLDLPADWDAYLAMQSPTRRQLLRRKERKLAREHAATLTEYAADRFDDGWQLLLDLHQRRWGGPGAFADPSVTTHLRVFRSLVTAPADFWLTTLDLDGQPAAAWCGFAWRDTVYFYQGGRDPRWDAESAGVVLMAKMIRRAIEAGYRRFDFMRGDESYKRSWTSTARCTYEVVIFRPSWRGAWLRGLDLARRARHRLRGVAPVRAAVEARSP